MQREVVETELGRSDLHHYINELCFELAEVNLWPIPGAKKRNAQASVIFGIAGD